MPPASRWAQPDIEAVLACSTYALCSISMSLCNKLVFSGADFDVPLAVLTYQSGCAVIFLKGGAALGILEPMPLEIELLRRMVPVAVLFCLMLWTSGKALRYCSMPFFTVLKNLGVVGITCYEYMRFHNPVSPAIAVSLALMILASLVAGAGDLTASPEGVLWMLTNVIVTVAYLAVLKECTPPNVSSSSKTLHNNVLTCVLFFLAALSSGQLQPFLDTLPRQPLVLQLGVLSTGVMGTAINMTTFWCMRVSSGAVYAFVGATNKIPIAVMGHWLFDSELTTSGWAGVVLGLGAGFLYAMGKERERRILTEQHMEVDIGDDDQDSDFDFEDTEARVLLSRGSSQYYSPTVEDRVPERETGERFPDHRSISDAEVDNEDRDLLHTRGSGTRGPPPRSVSVTRLIS
mmetsp:Transcript_24377/g.75924  ORF Transcript_24377/g.75924 Transcript_24377/m.75924 type:complete len:404 (-) Transcript_24377:47-1258(-)